MKKGYKYGGVVLATLMAFTLTACDDNKKEETPKEETKVTVNKEGKKVFSDFEGYPEIKLEDKLQDIWVVYNGNTDFYHLSYKDMEDPTFESAVYAKDTLRKVSDFGIVDFMYAQSKQELDPVEFSTSFEEIGNTYFNGITIIQNIVDYGKNTGNQNMVDWDKFKQAYENSLIELDVTIQVLEGIEVEGSLGQAVKESSILALKDGLEGLQGLEEYLGKDKELYGIGEEDTQEYMKENVMGSLYSSDYLYDLYYTLVDGIVDVDYDKKELVHKDLKEVYLAISNDNNMKVSLMGLLKDIYKDSQNVIFGTMSNIDLQFKLTSGAYKDFKEYKNIYNMQLEDVKKKYTEVKEKVEQGSYSEESLVVANVMLTSMEEGINSRAKYLASLKEVDGKVQFDEEKLLEAEKSKAIATSLNISLYKVYDLLANMDGYNDIFYAKQPSAEVDGEVIEGVDPNDLDELNIEVNPEDWVEKETVEE